MFVKHFEIINCTIVIFSRCDSTTSQNMMLSERSLCASTQKQVAAWDTQKLGNLRAVERPARKFGLISLLIKDIYLIKGNEGGGQQRFLCYVTGRRMLQWKKSCHWWLPATGGLRLGPCLKAGCEPPAFGQTEQGVWQEDTLTPPSCLSVH